MRLWACTNHVSPRNSPKDKDQLPGIGELFQAKVPLCERIFFSVACDTSSRDTAEELRSKINKLTRREALRKKEFSPNHSHGSARRTEKTRQMTNVRYLPLNHDLQPNVFGKHSLEMNQTILFCFPFFVDMVRKKNIEKIAQMTCHRCACICVRAFVRSCVRTSRARVRVRTGGAVAEALSAWRVYAPSHERKHARTHRARN